VRSIAIVGATILVMDDARTVIDEGTVVIEDGRFSAVEQRARVPAVDRVIDGAGRVLLPGLINCHAHTRPGRALGDAVPLFEWHALYPDGLCRQMTEDDSRVGSLLAFAESLKSGTTSIIVMTCKPQGAVAAADEIGIRGAIAPLAADDAHTNGGACDSYDESLELIAHEAPRRVGKRVRYWLGFDAIEGVSEDVFRRLAADAQRLDVGIHGHMSESKGDTDWPIGSRGAHAAVYLSGLGVLGRRTVLAHCNWLIDEEIDLLARTNTNVSHNPTSNMKLGVGVAPIPRLLEAGVNVGLGTDGMLSNFHLDMFEVMRGACMLQRVHHLNANALTSWDVLKMATRGGARALGQEDELGSIEVGKRADAILLDMRAAHLSPLVRGAHDNLIPLVVWCAHGSDVETVIVDGAIVVEARRLLTVQEDAIIAKAQSVSERLLATIPAGRPHR
jgi:5-methylthioadenosine/S-adenosylhomocysteine deaminase